MAGEGPQPWEQPGAVRRDCLPHRAPLLRLLGLTGLLLGVLALLVIPAILAVGLGIAVNELGKRDLARMAAGSMDPSGAADTRRAMWWGDLGLILALFAGALWAPALFVHFGARLFR
jgi:hypothetical protein